MSGFADYEQYDALGLADLVRRGKVTPTELLEAAIERVEARNGDRQRGHHARSTTTGAARSPTGCPTARSAACRSS